MSTGFTLGLGRIGHMLINRKKCLKANLAFSSKSGGLGLLSVGSVSGIGVISSYVIEWRLGSTTGSIVLLSGYNPNETVNVLHPFTNEPVQAGNLYAVIKYIIIDGIKYSPVYRQGQYSPDLKICFTYVTVNSINCSNGGNTTPYYSHTFDYVNSNMLSVDASRNIRFTLNSDGSTKFVAYNFVAYQVVDRIIVKYFKINDLSNPITLSDWAVGTNSVTNFTNNPKIYGAPYSQNLKQVIGLNSIPFTDGDYLTFEVIPRIYEPTNSNTNWQLNIKCLTSFDDYIPYADTQELDISTFGITWDAATCSHVFSFMTKHRYIIPDHFKTYLPERNVIYNGISYDGNTNRYLGFLYYKKDFNQSYPFTNTGCTNLTGNCNIKKVGNIITYTYNNNVDYQLFKTSYNNVITLASWLNYTTDNTNVNHYKYFVIKDYIGTICGDTRQQYNRWLHHDSVFVFDDTNKKITITIANTTNGIPQEDCNYRYMKVDDDITTINDLINAPNYEFNTTISNPVPVQCMIRGNWDTTQTNLSISAGCTVDHSSLISSLGFVPTGWKQQSVWFSKPAGFGFVMYNLEVIITNILDATNNYKVRTFLGADGSDISGTYIYEKKNGIQIIP